MGHAIILVIFGICGLLLPKEEKWKLMQREAEEWYAENYGEE